MTGIFLIGWLLSAPAYKGPLTGHFDGKRFINPGGVKAKGFRDLWKWMRSRERGIWKKKMDIPPGPSPARVVEGDEIRVTFIKHPFKRFHRLSCDIEKTLVLNHDIQVIIWNYREELQNLIQHISVLASNTDLHRAERLQFLYKRGHFDGFRSCTEDKKKPAAPRLTFCFHAESREVLHI